MSWHWREPRNSPYLRVDETDLCLSVDGAVGDGAKLALTQCPGFAWDFVTIGDTRFVIDHTCTHFAAGKSS